MRPYSLTHTALNDIGLIIDYIARRNPDAADRIIDALVKAFDRLADHPKLGHRRADLTDLPVRSWSVRDRLSWRTAHRDPARSAWPTRVAAELAQKGLPPRSGGR